MNVRSAEDSTVTVKIFVGFEYECPRGHRYMLQTPSKLLKHSGPGGPKACKSWCFNQLLNCHFIVGLCRSDSQVRYAVVVSLHMSV